MIEIIFCVLLAIYGILLLLKKNLRMLPWLTGYTNEKLETYDKEKIIKEYSTLVFIASGILLITFVLLLIIGNEDIIHLIGSGFACAIMIFLVIFIRFTKRYNK